jgi:hypothetical protein
VLQKCQQEFEDGVKARRSLQAKEAEGQGAADEGAAKADAAAAAAAAEELEDGEIRDGAAWRYLGPNAHRSTMHLRSVCTLRLVLTLARRIQIAIACCPEPQHPCI